MNNEHIDESISLDGIYEQCNDHLREQDKKRDQLLAFYGAIIGLVIANIDKVSKAELIEYLYIPFILIGFMLAYVFINYMRWHSIYNYSAITLQNIMFFKQTNLTQQDVNDIYYAHFSKHNFTFNYYLRKTESRIFNIFLLLSATNFFIYAGLLAKEYNQYKVFFIIGACVLAISYIGYMNYKAYINLKEIFNPKDQSKIPSWVLDLYSKGDIINDKLNKLNHSKIIHNKYFDIIYSTDNVTVVNKNQGVAVLPFTSDYKVLLLKVFREKVDKEVYEIPRGFLEENESPLNGSIRELLEETNLEAIQVNHLGIIYPDTGLTNSSVHLFAAEIDDKQLIKLQQSENILAYEYVDLDEILSMIDKGIINDSFTICCLHRALNNYFHQGGHDIKSTI